MLLRLVRDKTGGDPARFIIFEPKKEAPEGPRFSEVEQSLKHLGHHITGHLPTGDKLVKGGRLTVREGTGFLLSREDIHRLMFLQRQWLHVSSLCLSDDIYYHIRPPMSSEMFFMSMKEVSRN